MQYLVTHVHCVAGLAAISYFKRFL